jgi:hypothetical protein
LSGAPGSFLPSCLCPILFSKAADFLLPTYALFIFGTVHSAKIQISPFVFSNEKKILQNRYGPQNKEIHSS